ncbi:N-acetyltransferase [Pedobacter psychrodurus]|uniref:N-acetyltransferase n=2 Tax=Pedobacter psychrodurus TaxID=2530456 RepID=A0A4R0Q4V5_9SPHI|nr:N-acetyltransferase [Pedobacter psychrodurus]
MMEIKHIENGRKGSFQVGENESIQAQMTYLWSGTQKIIVDHTFVSPSLQGKGIGKQLFDQMIGFAREKKIKVLPLCPFARAQFDKDPQLNDVLF